MKRFGLYKTLFKPYVKLLHFLLKNTYEVFNRNIGFICTKIFYCFIFYANIIIVTIKYLVLRYFSHCVCHLQVILEGNAVFGCLLLLHDTVGD